MVSPQTINQRVQPNSVAANAAARTAPTGPWEIEWVVMTDIFCLMSDALKQTKFILAGLEVDAAQMLRAIDMTNGLVMSEAVMMGSGTSIGHEYAHDLVYDICREASNKKGICLNCWQNIQKFKSM